MQNNKNIKIIQLKLVVIYLKILIEIKILKK